MMKIITQLKREMEDDYLKKYEDFKMRNADRSIDQLKILKRRVESRETRDSLLIIMIGALVVVITSIISSVFTSEYGELVKSKDYSNFFWSTFPLVAIEVIGVGFLYVFISFSNSKTIDEKSMFTQLIEERDLQRVSEMKRNEEKEQKLLTKYKR